MNWITKAVKHFCLITRHKALVFAYACYAGIPWRGFMHDWSKYSPTEFFESVRYFDGKRSPVGISREVNGFSLAWLHHKGRNPHHYEYWLDWLDEKGTPIPMPFEYALEMVCDCISASKVYNGKDFRFVGLLAWWRRRDAKRPVNMHPISKRFHFAMLEALAAEESLRPLRRARALYDEARQAFEAEMEKNDAE